MRKKGVLVFISLVLALSLVIAGCAKPAPPPEEEVAPLPEEEVLPPPEEEVPPTPKVYKAGALTALSGYLALFGLAEKRGIELGVELINAEGGIKVGDETYLLEVIYGDTASDPMKALDAAYRLVFEDEVGIIYSGGDDFYKPTQAFFEENGVISFLGTQDPLTGPDTPRTFHTIATSPIEARYAVWKYMIENNPDVKTIAIITQDDTMGRSSGAVDEELAEYFGIELVEPPIYFSLATLDFAPLATKIVSLEPDILAFPNTFEPFVGLILEAATEMGPYPWQVILSSWTGADALAWAGFDPALVEGIITIYPEYTTDFWSPRAQEVAQIYLERHGIIDAWGLAFTDVAFQMKSALEQAGSTDKDVIYKYLSSPGAEIDSMLFGMSAFAGGDTWMYKLDRQLEVTNAVSVAIGGRDVQIDMMSWDEALEIWPFMTEERIGWLFQ